jgi:hypothetical protein
LQRAFERHDFVVWNQETVQDESPDRTPIARIARHALKLGIPTARSFP